MDDIVRACEDKLGKSFSISTIQKDIKVMKEDEALEYKAPICFSRSNQGYYYSDKEYSIHTIPLNSEEIESLEAMTDVLSAFTGSRISENYNQAVQKIFASLKEKTLQQEKRYKIIQTDSQIQHKGFENFEFFLHTIVKKIPVCFIHYSYKNRHFNSIIAHPLLLKEFQNKWYLVAYSEQHKCLRTFGLDRVSNPIMLKIPFHDTPSEITESYFSNVYGTYPLPNEKKQKIIFIANPLLSEYLKSNPIHKSQIVKKTGAYGSVVFELELIPSQELLNYFIQNSINIKVIKPQTLYKKVLESLCNAKINYSKK
jgi:predicted DNA-binding transcriptional regulator YafY